MGLLSSIGIALFERQIKLPLGSDGLKPTSIMYSRRNSVVSAADKVTARL